MRNEETLLINYIQSFLNRMRFLLYSHVRKINLKRDSINAFTRKCGYLRTGSKCSFIQEISSHAFTRNDWLCLYLSLACAVLERCAECIYGKGRFKNVLSFGPLLAEKMAVKVEKARF